MIIVLSLSAAIAYGLADFVGGVLTRRSSAWTVAVASQIASSLLIAALAVRDPGDFDTGAMLWGALAGIGTGAGNVFIYRGLAGGRMAVVAPLSAIVAAALPVVVGIAAGERPGILPLTGVVLALPAIWLVAGGGKGLRFENRNDVVNGLVAGIAFGVQFSALGQISHEAGLTPLALNQVVSVVAIAVGATAAGTPWIPRDKFSGLGVVAGVLVGIASLCFQLASRDGLTIAAALTSLYPAVTVLLAAFILREAMSRTQTVGLLLAVVAVMSIVSRQ